MFERLTQIVRLALGKKVDNYRDHLALETHGFRAVLLEVKPLEILNRFGPEGCHILAEELLRVAKEDVDMALGDPLPPKPIDVQTLPSFKEAMMESLKPLASSGEDLPKFHRNYPGYLGAPKYPKESK